MMKLFKVLLILHFFTAVCYSKEIAISFDDAPRGGTLLIANQDRSKLLVEALKKVKSPPVVFYCNTANFDEAGLKTIKTYTCADHLLANHSHSHWNLAKVGPEKFWTDIIEAHEILKKQKNFRPWFM